MWQAYKKEIMDKENDHQEFLKLYYQREHTQHIISPTEDDKVNGHEKEEVPSEETNIENNNYQGNNFVRDEDDWPVQVSSTKISREIFYKPTNDVWKMINSLSPKNIS